MLCAGLGGGSECKFMVYGMVTTVDRKSPTCELCFSVHEPRKIIFLI